MFREVLTWTTGAVVVTTALGLVLFRWDINRAYKRVRGKSKIISSPYGDIEYTEGGRGPHVLVIHGSGGGYDQGELIANALLTNQFHRITPSRFGYLRSTFRDGSTFDDQAHAYAVLLDHLGIDRVAVVALSHGGPSALLFAALYPERVSSLILISAGVVTVATETQKQADQQGNMLTLVFRYDWLYWGMTRLFKKQFLGLMGATRAVIAELTPEQQELADKIIEEMNPVSLRSDGTLFDNRAALPGDRIGDIQAPTLIFHATDDTLQQFHNAEFAADNIPGARLMRFERGGHLLLAVEQAAISTALQEHILEHSSPNYQPNS